MLNTRPQQVIGPIPNNILHEKNNVSHMQNQKNSFKDARILTIEIIDILPTNGMSTECHGTKPALSKPKNTIVHKKKERTI